ncbi:MAG: hypothetical protein ACHQIO_24375, partial [Nevskiales bacterium]
DLVGSLEDSITAADISTGQMINDKMCVPQSVQAPDGDYWEGRVEAQGFTGNQQYSVVLTMDGRAMTFDPFLKVS